MTSSTWASVMGRSTPGLACGLLARWPLLDHCGLLGHHRAR
ncbi:hypothetical protein ACIPUC_00720 [Streptomyces sp. LARHCF249]